jgi:tRNA (cytidine/uridine-2'-O-)-methyltransferase
MSGWVYIVTNRPNGILYTGVTSDLARRIWEHREGVVDGFTKEHGLHRLVYYEHHDDIRLAIPSWPGLSRPPAPRRAAGARPWRRMAQTLRARTSGTSAAERRGWPGQARPRREGSGEGVAHPATLAQGSGMRIALYEPDIPQNAGAILRLGACMGVPVDIIEPCGFLMDDRHLRRAAMDYLAAADFARHASWARYLAERIPGRLLLLTAQGDAPYHRFPYHPDDTLLLGRETAGVPPEVHACAEARLVIPLRPGLRSLNVAVAAAMVLGEALRQTGLWPKEIA